jgi:hypothetical protein
MHWLLRRWYHHWRMSHCWLTDVVGVLGIKQYDDPYSPKGLYCISIFELNWKSFIFKQLNIIQKGLRLANLVIPNRFLMSPCRHAWVTCWSPMCVTSPIGHTDSVLYLFNDSVRAWIRMILSCHCGREQINGGVACHSFPEDHKMSYS